MKCDHCENEAICNYQKIWVRYAIHNNNKEWGYGARRFATSGINDDPSGEDNEHLCKEHEVKFNEGNI